jgi:hypothetical protein
MKLHLLLLLTLFFSLFSLNSYANDTVASAKEKAHKSQVILSVTISKCFR